MPPPQTSRRALDADVRDVRQWLLRSLHTCLETFHEFAVKRELLRDHGMHAPLHGPSCAFSSLSFSVLRAVECSACRAPTRRCA